MKIIEAEAFFGTLDHARMSFEQGLSAVFLPNEAGKSTWCAFFRAMLYGMPQRERSTASYLAEKERYRPWAGQDAFGRMLVSYLGRNIVLERTFTSGGKTKDFRAYYEDTGFDVTGLGEENCGEILCGVGREAYEKSGFISYASMGSENSSELERKIQAIASSGDEDTSYQDAKSRLERLKNDIRANKANGMIPRLDARLAEVERDIAAIRGLAHNETSLRGRLLDLEREKDELKSKLQCIEEFEEYDRYRKIQAAEEQQEKLKEDYKKAEDAITFSGRQIDRAFLNETKDLLSSVREKKTAYAAAKEILAPLEKEFENTERLLKTQKQTPGEKPVSFVPIIIPAAVFAVCAALLTAFSQYLFAAGFGILSAGCFIFAVIRRKENREKEQVLCRAMEAYAGLEQEAKEKQRKFEDAKARALDAKTEYNLKWNVLSGIMAHLGIASESEEEMADGLNRLDRKVSDFQDIGYRLQAAKETGQALKQALGKTRGSAPEAERPEGSASEYKNRLDAVNGEYDLLYAEVNAVTGRIRQVGDLSKLESERELILKKKYRLQEQYDALADAAEVLLEASEELSQRVSPQLANTAGGYFTRMTEGKYSKVIIKRGFQELFASGLDGKMREALWFSKGTADQLYLSLRLALSDLILKSDEYAPLVLDDALIHFDEERLKAALDLLLEISKKRQIILFSCHEREQAYIEARKKGL